jgi:archaeal flagellar protein FlaI
MGEVKEMPVKRNFISGLLGKEGNNNFIPEIAKKVKSYFNKPLRTLPVYDPEKQGHLVEFVAPHGLKEIERYWLQEPYTFASIP